MAHHTAKFGLTNAHELFKKLEYDYKQLLRHHQETDEDQQIEEYEAFNFFVTAWALHNDWLGSDIIQKPAHSDQKIVEAHPHVKEIRHAIRSIANGSKHFSLDEAPKVAIGAREISSFSSYFFGPQYAIDTKSFHFLMDELAGIVMEYFYWIFDDNKPVSIPTSILEKLKNARELKSRRDKKGDNS